MVEVDCRRAAIVAGLCVVENTSMVYPTQPTQEDRAEPKVSTATKKLFARLSVVVFFVLDMADFL